MISIITPILNGEQHVEFCIKNVISQGCEGIEHLIIDGLSQDNSVDIVKCYMNKYDHIKLISGKDSGQSDAMNKGIAAAQHAP